MEMTGEYVIPAPRAAVWAALNDVAVLKATFPGCEAISPLAKDQIATTVVAKVGPLKASFKGLLTLSDLDPPNGYTIRGEGDGAAAGFARGSAKVRLSDAGSGTRLSYAVDATVGGKLAQIGARQIDAAAKTLADAFFAAFSAKITGRPVATPTPVAVAAPTVPPPPAVEVVKPVATPKRDALADFKPIGFGTWVLTLGVVAVIVAAILIIW